jgi:hypothetical protein
MNGFERNHDNGDVNSNFKISAASGSVYAADGVHPCPPQTYALLSAGLVFLEVLVNRDSSAEPNVKLESKT